MIKRLYLLLCALLCLSTSGSGQDQRHPVCLLQCDSLSRRDLDTVVPLLGGQRDAAVASLVRGRGLMLATEAETALLRERGYSFRVLMKDSSIRTLYKRALYGPSLQLPDVYHTYGEIIQEGDALIRDHPSLITRMQIGLTTQEKRPIYAFKLSGNAGAARDRPRVLFTGCHHADELMGAEICIALMTSLVRQYGKDKRTTAWMNEYEIFIIPVLNVDGHTVVTAGIDPRWRKNTHDTNGNGILYEFPEGVDVNRNYDFNWAFGGSEDPASERFRGEYPFSESENRALKGLAEQERFLLSVTYHSQGEVVYFPWDWRGRKAPDDTLLREIAEGLAASVKTMEGDTSYKAEYGAGTVGQSYPWLYGTMGTFDFVVEVGLGASFFPPEEVAGLVTTNLAGAHYILSRAGGPGLALRVVSRGSRKPLPATVRFPLIETEDLVRRTTDPSTGRFWRLLAPGRHTVLIQSAGYLPRILKEVAVAKDGWTTLEVELAPGDAGVGLQGD